MARMYPNIGFNWSNNGIVEFRGKCQIGNSTSIVTGKQGHIVFGDDFMNTGGIKIISFIGIKFGEHTRVGYETIFMDTNFHPLFDRKKNKFKKAYGPIEIGDNNWFGLQCYVMPSVITPHHCIFGARTIVKRGFQYESYCVHGGNPLQVLSRDVERIIGQDTIENYER